MTSGISQYSQWLQVTACDCDRHALGKTKETIASPSFQWVWWGSFFVTLTWFAPVTRQPRGLQSHGTHLSSTDVPENTHRNTSMKMHQILIILAHNATGRHTDWSSCLKHILITAGVFKSTNKCRCQLRTYAADISTYAAHITYIKSPTGVTCWNLRCPWVTVPRRGRQGTRHTRRIRR